MAAAMAAWSWRTWPDVFIDFGREAYVAWRLSEGDVLHRDIVYVSGPLSPYWNALAFRLFGASLDTLFLVNAAIFALLIVVWYGLIRRVADRLAAWAACTVFVTLFGFAQYVGIGNYNYVAPYSHELPHGLLLASLGLLCWQRTFRSGALCWWLLSGLALGLVALTKIEVFAAAAAASGLAFLARIHHQRSPRGDDAGLPLGTGAAVFAAGLTAPIVVATFALSSALGLEGGLRAVAVGWIRLLGDDVAALPFYQRGLGTDELSANLARCLLWAARTAGVLAPAAVVALALRASRFRRRLFGAAAGLAMAAGLAPFVQSIGWLRAGRVLPFFALGAFAVFVVRLARSKRPHDELGRTILQALLAAFATALMAKIFFFGRIYQYGFALALPATLLFVATLVCWIPDEIDRRGGAGVVFRGAALGLLAIAILGHGLAMAPHLASKTGRLGGVDDAIRVQPGIARVVAAALEEVNARTRPGESLSVMPEGAMLNFLTRRPTPTPHFSFNPFELHVYGEEAIIDAFRESPPAAVVLVHHDTSEHGARFLGRDYGVKLLEWIRSHYKRARLIGDPPLKPGTRFGIEVLERKAANAASTESPRPSPSL